MSYRDLKVFRPGSKKIKIEPVLKQSLESKFHELLLKLDLFEIEDDLNKKELSKLKELIQMLDIYVSSIDKRLMSIEDELD